MDTVKFNFFLGSPGYAGDLFILKGDVLTGDASIPRGKARSNLSNFVEPTDGNLHARHIRRLFQKLLKNLKE